MASAWFPHSEDWLPIAPCSFYLGLLYSFIHYGDLGRQVSGAATIYDAYHNFEDTKTITFLINFNKIQKLYNIVKSNNFSHVNLEKVPVTCIGAIYYKQSTEC